MTQWYFAYIYLYLFHHKKIQIQINNKLINLNIFAVKRNLTFKNKIKVLKTL